MSRKNVLVLLTLCAALLGSLAIVATYPKFKKIEKRGPAPASVAVILPGDVSAERGARKNVQQLVRFRPAGPLRQLPEQVSERQPLEPFFSFPAERCAKPLVSFRRGNPPQSRRRLFCLAICAHPTATPGSRCLSVRAKRRLLLGIRIFLSRTSGKIPVQFPDSSRARRGIRHHSGNIRVSTDHLGRRVFRPLGPCRAPNDAARHSPCGYHYQGSPSPAKNDPECQQLRLLSQADAADSAGNVQMDGGGSVAVGIVDVLIVFFS